MIILVGMPGCGKSTVGRALARRLDLPFADADVVIEARIGCSIREYFDRHGEAAFRDVEQDVIDELTQRGRGILATGGGSVLRAVNRKNLHERGTVIYMHTPPERIYRRLRHDKKRPLLQVADPLGRLRDLYAVRDPLYRECAHYVLNVHRGSMSMLLHRILMQVEMMPEFQQLESRR